MLIGIMLMLAAAGCVGGGQQGEETKESPAPIPAAPPQPDADVLHVRAVQAEDGTWTFTVTVEHPDTGWKDYADGWDAVLPDGTVVKPDPASPFTRLLLHPHVKEQPFTRSQSGILLPPGVTLVRIRAHDLVSGYGGREVLVDLGMKKGKDFEAAALPTSRTIAAPLGTVSLDVSYPSGAVRISGYLSKPKAEGRVPAVIILHGTEGYQEHHREYARGLAEAGYVALAVCWFGCQGGRGSLSEVELGDITASVEYLKALDYVDGNRIGVIGFSRGASLALLSASRISDFKAAVDYYGPARISTAFTKLLQGYGSEYGVENLRGPVLILHGADDQTVNVGGAYKLEKLLMEHGKAYEMKIYPGVGHAFNWVDGKGVYDPGAAEDAWKRTKAFLDERLRG